MFVKPIDRDIQGVIKVGQDDKANKKQELEEYVVTRELRRHFRDFFTNYKKGIVGKTDKVGVWISGFFGSGKSHFLKILAYLLEKEEVDGKRPLDYFIEDEKIGDPAVIAAMELACNTPTDVILFNIDSKSRTAGTKGKDSILNVFLRVFNEKLGFSTDPHLADLERQLMEEGKYEEFQTRYEEMHNLNWKENRHKFKFHKDKVVKTLVDIEFMSEETARDWSRSTTKAYELSIEEFAHVVKEYLDSKGEDHHIVFLVDEMGQYIGENSDLMLNLQTITEDLGTICQGRAWVVVTSQQDLDSIATNIKELDFSKIQGRFDTRLNLTSANVDEVIKLRILEKTETAKETLGILYENNETIIKNLLVFNDGVEKKLYENKEDFCQVYPFIPYQFNLLGGVLTSIRKHGASGKHLSEGERSMLALFKESAEKLMNEDDGALVPLHVFYDGLEKFLDHNHAGVISRAAENRYINPTLEEDNFNVNVLKTLFLIKYLTKEIEPNLENITTLMVSHINEDRIELKERVQTALNILIQQNLVEKNGDLYIFLTDEEQEVNREIKRQHIEAQLITRKIAEIIYTDILAAEDKISSNKFGSRYNFGFNRFVDGEAYGGRANFEIGIDIITPSSEKNGLESTLRMNSQRENIVYVDLPPDGAFIEEIRTSMQIGQYLQTSSTSKIQSIEKIKEIKREEMREYYDRGKLYLEEALKEAKFYVNGEKLGLNNKNFKFNVQESLRRLVEVVYHKLDYIDTPVELLDIRNLFKNKDNRNIRLGEPETPNANAIREVLDYIKLRTKTYDKISLKEIKDKFTRAPYGFVDVDVEWIIAKLFVDGNISFTLNGETVSLLNEDEDQIINYITKKQYAEKLLIEEKEVVDERYIRSLKNIASTLFNKEITIEDTDMMVKEFNDLANDMIEELEEIKANYKEGKYPGQRVIDEGIEIINHTRGMSKPMDVFKHLYKNEDTYLDFTERYSPIKSFFGGSQKEIWEKSQHYISIYDESKSYILNEEIEKIVEEMKYILDMASPYKRIKDLPELNDKFLDLYNDILDKELEPVVKEIEKAKERVMEELVKTGLVDRFGHKYSNGFDDLIRRAEACNNVARVNGFKIEADTLKNRYLKEISEAIDIPPQPPTEDGTEEETPPVVRPVKRRKYVSIKDINPFSWWRIENKEDIDRYLQELRERLEKEMEENTILNIEF